MLLVRVFGLVFGGSLGGMSKLLFDERGAAFGCRELLVDRDVAPPLSSDSKLFLLLA